MRALNITPPIIALLPSLVLLPVLSGIAFGLHFGGVPLILEFLNSALNPSLDPIVVKAALKALEITLGVALISWIISSLIGLVLGIISSNLFWKVIGLNHFFPIIIRRILAVPRSIHELIWGLLLLQFIGFNLLVAILAIIIPYSCLFARVISDQIDVLDERRVTAIIQSGSGGYEALITTIAPPMAPIIYSHTANRLECALRGATLLGVFGLGGLGTELQLTLQSLNFREMWTSIWLLIILVALIERLVGWLKNNDIEYIPNTIKLLIPVFIFTSTLILSLYLLKTNSSFELSTRELDLHWNPPNINQFLTSLHSLPWIKLLLQTLCLTFLASFIAISGPPLGMMISSSNISLQLQSIFWTFLRVIPAPLFALLILLCSNPSIWVAALALGLHHLGIMGRVLKENLESQSNSSLNAIKASGASDTISWIYEKFTSQSTNYLAYGAYRTDVILRETSAIGLVGGSGLGWQLLESLSSFNWAEIIIVVCIYFIITITGETLTDHWRLHCIKYTRKEALVLNQSI